MQRTKRFMACALMVGGTFVASCSGSTTAAPPESPAAVEGVPGQPDIKLITLTDKATQRLGVETALVRDDVDPESGTTHKVVPFAALIYSPEGNTFVYTAPAANKFVRAPITVTRIVGDDVIVSDGPAAGTKVVTVGAAELLGTEYGVGED